MFGIYQQIHQCSFVCACEGCGGGCGGNWHFIFQNPLPGRGTTVQVEKQQNSGGSLKRKTHSSIN